MALDSTAEQLLTMDNNSLARYLRNNWGPHQMLNVEAILDWDTTPKSRQDELLQRFKAVCPGAQEAQFLDHKELVARLEAIARADTEPPLWDEDPFSQLIQPTSGPTVSRVGGSDGKMQQTRCYRALVSEGGRPPCPLELLRDVYKRPAQHVELMKPWLGDPAFFTGSADELGVFSRPLMRWRQFRRWQADNRGISLPKDTQDLVAFREAHGRYYEASGLAQLTQVPDYKEAVEALWHNRRKRRRWEREKCREDGSPVGDSFENYAEAARHRLHTHGFTENFQLHRETARQDATTTWIEYLGFECWWLDWRDAELERCKAQRGVTWAEMRRVGILRESETEIDVLVYVDKAQRRGRRLTKTLSSGGEQGAQLRRQQKEVDGDVNSSWESATQRREDLTRQFSRDSEAGRSAEAFKSSQVLLLSWARSQMAEMKEEATKAEGGLRGSKRTSAELFDDEVEGDAVTKDNLEERMAKKQMRFMHEQRRTDEEWELWRREIEEKIMAARHRALLQIRIITTQLQRQAEQ